MPCACCPGLVIGLLRARTAHPIKRRNIGTRRGKYGVTQFLKVFEDVGATFFELETDLLLVLDERGCVERANPAWEKATGYSEIEALHVPITHFVCVNDYAVFLRSFTDGKMGAFRLLHQGGGVVWVRLIACRFRRRFPLEEGEFETAEQEIQRQAFMVIRPVK